MTIKINVRTTYIPGTFCPEDGGSKSHQNNGKHLPDCMASHPKRQTSPYKRLYLEGYMTNFAVEPGTHTTCTV
jgi:hypothetical protein